MGDRDESLFGSVLGRVTSGAGRVRSVQGYGQAGVQTAVTIGPPAYADDTVIRAVADVLVKSSKFHQAGITAILEPYGATEQSVSLALQLVAGGTSTIPNARLKEHGASLDLATPGIVRKVRDAELYPRAAYVVAAALRMQKTIDTLTGAAPVVKEKLASAKEKAAGAKERVLSAREKALGLLRGDDEFDDGMGRGMDEAEAGREALRVEKRYFKQHEQARKGRLLAAAQVQVAMENFGWAEEEGTLVGWYLNPLLNNDAECIAANGNNFYAEKGTIIGLPGAVHPNCGCYAGPPHIGGEMVNEVLSKVAVLDHHRPKKVRLKKKTKKEGA